MKLLVLGSGGREHALVWRLAKCEGVDEVYCAPGNGGIARIAKCYPVDPANASEVAALVSELQADLVMVGPEGPLVSGVADDLIGGGHLVAGPTRAAARLEGSKIFAKQFMQRHRIPTAEFVT